MLPAPLRLCRAGTRPTATHQVCITCPHTMCTVWSQPLKSLRLARLALHSVSTLKVPKPKKERHLRPFGRLIYWAHASPPGWLWPPATETHGRRFGWVIGLGCRRNQGLRHPTIPVITPVEQVKPVACFTHPEIAQRGAVWKVGPRPDRNRSARNDEPGRTAIRPGDGCRSLASALPRRISRRWRARGERWLNAPTSDSRCEKRPPDFGPAAAFALCA